MSKKEVVLIDLSGLLHPAWHVNEHGPVSATFDATIGGVHRCASKSPGALVAICLDSRKSWRKELEPSYKAHREKLPNAFYDCSQRVIERLKADGFLVWQVEGMEADDILATATRKATEAGHDVLVCSTDKDLLQLMESPKVRVLSLSTWEIKTQENVIEKFGVSSEKIADWLALVGDASDGVKGCPGVGPKRATELLSRWGNLTALGCAVEADATVTTPAIAKALMENWPQIELARKLVELRYDVPLNFDEIYQERVVQKLIKTEVSMESDDIPISKGPGNVAKAQEVFKVEAQTNQITNEMPLHGMPTVSLPSDVAVEQTTKQYATLTGETALNGLLQKDFIPREYELALEPRSPDGAVKLAERLWNSRLFQQFGNEDAILAAMHRARAMGIPAVAALNCFHVIDSPQGKGLAPYAYLMVHLAGKDPNCEYILPIEASATSATWETKHRKFPTPFRLTYTLEQAKIAGLVELTKTGKPSNYMKNPEDMLVARCGAKMSRRYYSGAVMGLVAFEELSQGDE